MEEIKEVIFKLNSKVDDLIYRLSKEEVKNNYIISRIKVIAFKLEKDIINSKHQTKYTIFRKSKQLLKDLETILLNNDDKGQ